MTTSDEKLPPSADEIINSKDSADMDYNAFREEESLLKLLESDDIPDIINDPELQMKLESACDDSELQEKLDRTSDLLTSLHQEQNSRLSQGPGVSGDGGELQRVLWEVGSNEEDLATKVRDNLTEMVSGHANPRDVVSQESVRDAMSSDLLDQVGKL